MGEGSGEAVGSASGDDDGASLVTVAGPQAARLSRNTATTRALTETSLLMRQPSGPEFAGRASEEIRLSWSLPMPPRGVKSAKRKRQYEHIKRSESARGRSNKVAERIAAATTNKTRRKKGETK
jgi:hypothetical protein